MTMASTETKAAGTDYLSTTCERKALTAAVAAAKLATASRGIMPVMSHVRVSSGAHSLTLTGHNFEWAITTRIPATTETAGEGVCVPVRQLADVLAAFTAGIVTLTASKRALQIAGTTIVGLATDDMPLVPLVEGGMSVKLDPEGLRRAIRQVAYAAAADDNLGPVRTGVHVLLENGALTMAAADGFRLSVRRLDLDSQIGERTEIIIPAPALKALVKLLKGVTEAVEMTVNEARTHVLFRLGATELVSQLIPGTFPNYRTVIPPDSRTRVTVRVAELLHLVKQAAPFAKFDGGIVRLQTVSTLALSQLLVSARAADVGEHRGEVAATIDGDAANKIALNYAYLTEVLQVLDAEKVTIEITEPYASAVLRPVGSEGVYVIMPMFVQW